MSSLVSFYTQNPSIYKSTPEYLNMIETAYSRQILRMYSDKYSYKNSKWLQIFEKSPYIFNKQQLLKRHFHALQKNWTLQKIKEPEVQRALLNYKLFKNMNELPHYSDVRQSSAGIQGWLEAGPHKL
tara:strand:+ start:257 stop:637 length:381 start_codon:yes stop_codon:yes gene_type:complete